MKNIAPIPPNAVNDDAPFCTERRAVAIETSRATHASRGCFTCKSHAAQCLDPSRRSFIYALPIFSVAPAPQTALYAKLTEHHFDCNNAIIQ